MLEVKELKKNYVSGIFKREYFCALDTVSLRVEKGKSLGIVGESGSGKSTLAQCIVRLVEPSGGKIIFDGLDITAMRAKELKEIRSKIQVIFQDPDSVLDPKMTIGQSIAEALRINHVKRKNIPQRVSASIHMVGLNSEHSNRYPHQLSGGQNQRAVLARALAFEPSLIIADEPTASLDVSVQAQILQLLKGIKEKNKMTLIIISHDLDIVRHVCDDVAVMYKGKIVENGPVGEVFAAPAHTYTRMLMDCNDETISAWKHSLKLSDPCTIMTDAAITQI